MVNRFPQKPRTLSHLYNKCTDTSSSLNLVFFCVLLYTVWVRAHISALYRCEVWPVKDNYSIDVIDPDPFLQLRSVRSWRQIGKDLCLVVLLQSAGTKKNKKMFFKNGILKLSTLIQTHQRHVGLFRCLRLSRLDVSAWAAPPDDPGLTGLGHHLNVGIAISRLKTDQPDARV